MKLIRCDVKGCNEECKGDEPGVVGALPPGWRNEIWSEERRMPVPAAQAHALSLEEAGEVRNVTVRPLEPQEVRALAHGYAHHIQRLMVTGLFALLAGVRPREIHAWYLAVYVDAVEWVELPNTAGMALYANGGRFTTKPYAASGAYIRRMSNYCKGCRYRPEVRHGENACPMTTLYWNFIDTHAPALGRNPRTALMVRNLDRLSVVERQEIRAHAGHLLADPESL